jgi:hypothetical protein
MAKIFEVWSEGYRATGERGEAFYHGSASGESFKEACIELAARKPAFSTYFDRDALTHWGCKLFDNEADARRSFG